MNQEDLSNKIDEWSKMIKTDDIVNYEPYYGFCGSHIGQQIRGFQLKPLNESPLGYESPGSKTKSALNNKK